MDPIITWKLLWLAVAIVLVVVPVLVDIQFATHINASITFHGRSTNKTFTFRRTSLRSKAITNTANTTSRQARPNFCTPDPNQPLAILHHTRKQLDAPRITPQNATAIDEIVCDYHGQPDAHFPHVMQQLYRCFSYFQDYPTKSKYLLVPSHKVKYKLGSHSFVSGVMNILEEQMSVEIRTKQELDQQALDDLATTSNIDIQAFNLVGNYSLRHVDKLHEYTTKELNLMDDSYQTCNHDKPRIAILDRAVQSSRSMLNANNISNLEELKTLSRNGIIPVKYFEKADFEEQVSFFRSTDILISPHGAQLTGIAFMNAPCSHVLELFPKVRMLLFL